MALLLSQEHVREQRAATRRRTDPIRLQHEVERHPPQQAGSLLQSSELLAADPDRCEADHADELIGELQNARSGGLVGRRRGEQTFRCTAIEQWFCGSEWHGGEFTRLDESE